MRPMQRSSISKPPFPNPDPIRVTPASAPLRLWLRHSTPWAWTLPYWPTTTAATADRKASVRRSGNSTGTASNIRAFSGQLGFPGEASAPFEAGGIRFALLNYTYGTNGLPVPSGLSVNPIDTVRIAADLAAVEHDGVDCVIACMHWGNEYERRPNKVQRQLAGFLRRHGVDLIVGSHPHVVQPYEQDSNGIVLYSLGNFVSNQRKRYCDGGIVATVEVTRSPDGSLRYSLELTPVWVLTPGYRITPSEVGDTLSMPADSRLRYERFMTDTRLLLGL